MLGVIFTTFIDMLETTYSAKFADEIVDGSNLKSCGGYLATGYYNVVELEQMVNTLSAKTSQPAEQIMFDYAHFLFNVLVEAHGSVLQNKHSVFDVLESLDDDIHRWVLNLYPDADLPTFTVISHSHGKMVVEYCSRRKLYSLAEGLISATAKHFGNQIICTTEPSGKDDTYVFTLMTKESNGLEFN